MAQRVERRQPQHFGAFDLRARHRVEAGPDNLGEIGGGGQRHGNGGDAEQRQIRRKGLHREQHEDEDDEEGDAPEGFDVERGRPAQRRKQARARAPQEGQPHADHEANRAADERHPQGAAQRSGQKGQRFRAEQIAVHARRTPNRARPARASSAEAIRVSPM